MSLTYRQITDAKVALDRLLQEKMPVKVASEIAKLSIKLRDPVDAFALVRDGLLSKYQIETERGEGVGVKVSSGVEGNIEKFEQEFNELLDQRVQLVFAKVKLPEKIASTCDKCSHNMDKPLEIEPEILVALDEFVEV